MKHFLIVILAFTAHVAFAKPPCPPPEEIHGNLDCEMVPEAPPTAAQLDAKGKAFISKFTESDLWGKLDYLNTAKAQVYYSISRYYDYETDKVEARILGVYTAQNAKRDVLFGIFFNEAGEPLKIQGLKTQPDQECVPFYFYKPGHYNVLYHAVGKQNLYQLQASVKEAFVGALEDHGLLAGGEVSSESLQPNSDSNESQQRISIDNGLMFLETAINEHKSSLKVRGATNIFASLERSGALADGLAVSGDPAVCKQIK